jgi:Na+-translocating ferredoxin:NAD+ oxidoreductase subunit B
MMSKTDEVYRTLQKHLDQQPVGYPATRSGAELRLLERMFTPEEARLALKLSYKARSAEEIFLEMNISGMPFEEMKTLLDAMAKKLVIGQIDKEGSRCFFLIPLIVGMYEGQLNRLTPEFLSDFDAYVSDKTFGISFLATELPQMRTIPVGKSITPKHPVATYDQIEHLLSASGGPFVINACICRQAAVMKGKVCHKTKREETCLAIGDVAKRCISAGLGREIGKEEALSISRENEADGLVLQPSNARNAEFICACCGCCCGMLKVHKMLPRPLDYWASNFHASVDADACSGCGTCIERCEVDAVTVDNPDGVATVNSNRCIGCGNCVSTCPSEAIRLMKKEKEVAPPSSAEELYDIIMANKKGAFAKMKLAARLMRKK